MKARSQPDRIKRLWAAAPMVVGAVAFTLAVGFSHAIASNIPLTDTGLSLLRAFPGLGLFSLLATVPIAAVANLLSRRRSVAHAAYAAIGGMIAGLPPLLWLGAAAAHRVDTQGVLFAPVYAAPFALVGALIGAWIAQSSRARIVWACERSPEGFCTACGYPTDGLDAVKCPECGAPRELGCARSAAP